MSVHRDVEKFLCRATNTGLHHKGGPRKKKAADKQQVVVQSEAETTQNKRPILTQTA